MVDPLLQQLLRGFVDESQEICDRITRDLLEIERSAPVPASTFDDLARGLHTLKGSAATLGLDELADVAHRMEDVVAPLRRRARLPAAVADALLRSLDSWMSGLRALAAGAPLPDLAPTSALLADAEALVPRLAAGDTPSPAPTAAAAGDAFITGTDEHGASEATWRVGTRQVAALLHDVERLREVRLRLEERQRELERALAQLARAGQALRKASSAPAAGSLAPAMGADARAAIASASRGLGADIAESSDIVASLEDGLKAISTQPMRTILEPLRRAVRDLCRQSGKLATLSVVGGEVSLDRRLLELLRSPLVHLVRNAVDHGIEAPDQRERLGKHAEGALVVRVEQQGNMLFIEVADDGSGVDLAKVREAALARGLHSAEELDAMGPSLLQQLIFRPGFSTRETISELSGRGIGLDIVRSQIQALSGHVEVQSVQGQGTRFVLTLPAELGSSAVLLVACGEHQVGVPTMSVESSRAVRGVDLRGAGPQLRYAYRDELIPLIDLGLLLGVREAQAPRHDDPLLIVASQGQRLALAVDEVLGDRELVVRPLPRELRDLAAYQGAATLARGELVLILRPEWLATALQRPTPLSAARPRALVVDDSLSGATMLRAALDGGGFAVHTATSPARALEQLRRALYDVIVCDVGLERLDGAALAAAVRGRAGGERACLVFVAGEGGDVDRRRAREAGADIFITKGECAAGRLVAEARLVCERRGAAGGSGA